MKTWTESLHTRRMSKNNRCLEVWEKNVTKTLLLIDEAVNTLMEDADGQIRATLSARIKFPNDAAAAWAEDGSSKVAWP